MGISLGLLSAQDYDKVIEKYAAIEKEIEHLRATKIPPGTPLDEILRKCRQRAFKAVDFLI